MRREACCVVRRSEFSPEAPCMSSRNTQHVTHITLAVMHEAQ